MRKTSIIAAGILLSSGLVAGCGSSDGGGSSAGSGYCDTLKSEASTIKSFTAGSTPDFAKFKDFIDDAHKLADKAPSEIKDDWTVLLGAMDGLSTALEKAGIKVEDFGAIIASGQLPAGVDPAKLAELTTTLQSIASADVTKAATAISTHAKDQCKVDLAQAG